MEIRPDDIISFPGGRVVFSVYDNNVKVPLSDLDEVEVIIQFPSQDPYVSPVNLDNDTFSWIVPIDTGENDIDIHLRHAGGEEHFTVAVKINPVKANRFTLETSPEMYPTGGVYCQIYNPLGSLVHSGTMTYDGYTYSFSATPGDDWIEGEYTASVTDETGVIDVIPAWIERPSLAAMKEFYTLPEWQRQLIEFLKFDMLSDTEPLAPAAFFTLEEYTRFWKATVREINSIQPRTSFQPESIPTSWADVMTKGTFLQVVNALANRSVTVPRWTGNDMPMRDESHLQQAWEARAAVIKPDYEEERAYLKGEYITGPMVTVDPFFGFTTSSLGGQAALSRINMPSWFGSPSGWR